MFKENCTLQKYCDPMFTVKKQKQNKTKTNKQKTY